MPPKAPKVIQLSPEEYARQRKIEIDRSERYLVIGDAKIRCAVERESKIKGQFVWLDPEVTVIPLLVAAGYVEPAPVDEQEEAPADTVEAAPAAPARARRGA